MRVCVCVCVAAESYPLCHNNPARRGHPWYVVWCSTHHGPQWHQPDVSVLGKGNVDRYLWGKHEGDGQQLTAAQSMISGFTAAFLGPIATGPMDVIKTRLMAQGKAGSSNTQYKGLLDALVRIPQQEGIFALWKGLLPRLMRIPPGQAIVWAVSDQITGQSATPAAASVTV
eukprot:GHUV01047122.1.p1 GENE.GHUV01047122.1~~GHUV01047122.1.p1  ORF type:complete len:171 (+),score=60.42 GHUV01047122.1:56-568(+)